MLNKEKLAQEITINFNLNTEQTEAALLLFETRAANMDMSLEEYMQAYHPLGFSEKDYRLSDEYKGYVQFLADDAKAIIRTGKTADFFTFLHEQAHIYRRQLSGDLKDKAEKAFGVENGTWTRHQEELFAIGYEEYARLRMAQTEDLREVYEKGCRCMRHIYNGLDRIIELNPDIIKVYDVLFTESRFRFKQDEFETALQNISKNNIEGFKSSHVYLGMTPSIYQELGFERLPVMMSARHLKTVMQEWGSDTSANYHGLSSDIIAQIPEALKKPLVIMQSQNKENAEDIISVVELKDKNNNPIIIPLSPNKKGRDIHNFQIDINLAKTIYGKENFEKSIERGLNKNRILYLNEKSRVLASPRVQFPSNQGSQLLYDNIARYQEIVKQKHPDFSQLYQQSMQSENIEKLRKQLEKIDAEYGKKLEKAEKKADKVYEQWWKENYTDKNAVWDAKNDEAVHKIVTEWQQQADTVRKQLNGGIAIHTDDTSILFQKSSYYSKSTQKEKREQEIAQIADYFVKAIENNTAPWMKPWKASEYINDFNPVTQTTYSGINSVLLPLIREFKFHSADPRWYTFNNAKKEGHMVKKENRQTRSSILTLFLSVKTEKHWKLMKKENLSEKR